MLILCIITVPSSRQGFYIQITTMGRASTVCSLPYGAQTAFRPISIVAGHSVGHHIIDISYMTHKARSEAISDTFPTHSLVVIICPICPYSIV